MYKDINEEIEYIRLSIKRIINFSIDYIFENNFNVFDNLNIVEYKQTLYFFIEPIIIFYKDKTGNYTISQDKIIFLSNYEYFKTICYDLQNKNISNIYNVSLYVLRKVLWFFNLIFSENNDIIGISEKQCINKTINDFITLISILLEMHFTNGKQIPDIKELIESIKTKLNISNIKDILPNINSNTEFRLLACIINRFELDKREIEIDKLNKLNIRNLKSKDKNKTIIDRDILKNIKETITTFITTSAITFAIIKAIVYIVSLIAEKIPMLSSIIDKGSTLINNSAINFFNSSKTGNNKPSKTNYKTKRRTKDSNSSNRGRRKSRNNINQTENKDNSSSSGKSKENNPNNDNSLMLHNRINGESRNNPPNYPAPSKNYDNNNYNGNGTNIKSRENNTPTNNPDIVGNCNKIESNHNEDLRDTNIDFAENNNINDSKCLKDDYYDMDNILNMFADGDEFSSFRNKNRKEDLDEDQTNQKNFINQEPYQDISKLNTNNLPSTSLPKYTNINPKQNILSQNNTKHKVTSCIKSIIEQEKKKHKEDRSKTHTIKIKNKEDNYSPDNSPSLQRVL